MFAQEHLVDAHGCDERLLADVGAMSAVCARLVRDLELVVIGAPQWHRFPDTSAGPGGTTGLYLLSESHLAVHTWPEHRALALNVCCCRPRAAFPFESVLTDLLRAEGVVVRTLERG